MTNQIETREMKIAQRRAAIIAELGELRQATSKHSYIDSSGTLKVSDSPELAALQSQIKDREQALALVDDATGRISAALKEAGVGSIEDLQERRRELAGIIESAPYRCWEKFRLLRELPVTSGGHPDLLPGELTQIDSYKQFEKTVKQERDAARKELETVQQLTEECARLAVAASNA